MTIRQDALVLTLKEIVLNAIQNHNCPLHYMPESAEERRRGQPATIHSDESFLRRIVQNFLRHSCTDYDAQLEALVPSHPDDCVCTMGCYGDSDMMDEETGECCCPGCADEVCDFECTDPDEAAEIRADIQDEIDQQWDPIDIELTIEQMRVEVQS